jgi:peptidyl-prolyl cis-trans isomerase SurA
VPEFEEALDKVQLGSLSPPVVTRFGVHLIQAIERRSVSVDPKEVREQARNQLREGKFEPTYLEWAKELRLRAYIEMREPPL